MEVIELKILKVSPNPNNFLFCDYDDPVMVEWITNLEQFESAYIEVDKNNVKHYYIKNDLYTYEVKKSHYIKIKKNLLKL